ncbi:hypothetical protein RJ639_033024 [Escallonia herrerae]|uniref:Serine-threonine/tyrosine-protein kinase catalytic domain-containing protein n=1 Tax=Escallonia herrerae TaxID=1293975 RepID=A0AA88WXY8_9ASTE|nr:hypothetical protein RJ639_033024 [Escallonia herrerae]
MSNQIICTSEATPQSNGMSFPNPLELSQADLAEFTNNFHGGNLIGPTQFGKLYRGKINARDVTVKIWDGGQHAEQYGEPYGLECPGGYSIMLAESNPVVVEFGLMRGGSLGQLSPFKELIPMSPGYCDMYYARTGVGWVAHCDVFSYGVILLGLIAKEYILVDDWVWKQNKPGCSLVHISLEDDLSYRVDDGPVITELAMRCVKELPENCPTMKSVVKSLEGLLVVQHSHVKSDTDT